MVAILPFKLSIVRSAHGLRNLGKTRKINRHQKVPMRARVNGISMNKPGRPDKSTTTRDKASSNGA